MQAVGDGDNDGKNEVYATNIDNNVYQFKWVNGNWEKKVIGTGSTLIVIGDANNDGKNEVIGSGSKNIIQYKYTQSSSSWSQTNIYSGTKINRSVIIGNSDTQ